MILAPADCGCGVADIDRDSDGVQIVRMCPYDPAEFLLAFCGWGGCIGMCPLGADLWGRSTLR